MGRNSMTEVAFMSELHIRTTCFLRLLIYNHATGSCKFMYNLALLWKRVVVSLPSMLQELDGTKFQSSSFIRRIVNTRPLESQDPFAFSFDRRDGLSSCFFFFSNFPSGISDNIFCVCFPQWPGWKWFWLAPAIWTIDLNEVKSLWICPASRFLHSAISEDHHLRATSKFFHVWEYMMPLHIET